MSWQTLRCRVRDDEVPRLESLLEELGALATTVEADGDQLVFDTLEDSSNPLWRNCWLETLFPRDANFETILAHIAAAGFTTDSAQRQVIADRDWHLAWRDQSKPICFAERLWVVPSWHATPATAEIVIRLDPGMAFGTGTHPTTALCLEWLVREDRINGSQVLDYGCGSGILAIAAAKLGAASVTAIDLDPQACVVTRENAEANQCFEIEIGEPPSLPSIQFDLLVANLLLKPIITLAPLFSAHVRCGGRIALSGVLRDQVDAVLDTYADTFKMQTPRFADEWALIIGERSEIT